MSEEKRMIFNDIVCQSQCFLCMIKWNGKDSMEINRCDLHLCDDHFREATKGCLAFNRFKKKDE